MRQVKPFEELEFRDSFMFAAAMEDVEICRKVLERILEIPIEKVRVHTESMLLINPEYRGIRMDVYADDGVGTVYDVEMQTVDKGNLPKRSRLYQSHMDVAALEPGMDFNQLPENFVIFICTFDPFGRGLYRYTYENICREDGDRLRDGTYKIFLNTRGINREDVPEPLINFLDFVDSTKTHSALLNDSLLQTLQDRICYLKKSRRLEECYMLFGEILDDERKAEREEVLSLVTAMVADNRTDDLPRLQTDPAFLQEMLEAYQIIVD